MGPIWGRQDPGGPHVGPMNFAVWDGLDGFESELLKPCHFTDMEEFEIQNT